MTNKEFANLLSRSIEKGKLNSTPEIEEFIIKFGGNASGKISMKVGRPTNDQKNLVASIKNEVNDSQLEYLFNEIVPTTTPKAEPIVVARGSYKGGEW